MEQSELELIDYLDVLGRWKRLIFATVAIALIAAAVVGVRLPAAYNAAATIDVGSPRGETHEDALKQLTAELQRKWEGTAVTVTSPAVGRVRLQSTGSSENAARAQLQTAVEDARNGLGRAAALQQDRFKYLQREIETLRSVASELRAAQVKSLERADPQSVLFFQIASSELARTEDRIHDIDEELQFGMPSMVESTVVVARAQGVSLRLLLAVALLAGTVSAVLLAFVMDYLDNARRRRVRYEVVSRGDTSA